MKFENPQQILSSNKNQNHLCSFLKQAAGMENNRTDEFIRELSADFEETENARADTSATAGTAGINQEESATRQRRRSGGSATEYTKPQVDLVKRVNKCTNFYEVLGVESDASVIEIKKAYKRLALQLHPDKNRAPGAAEAFKTVASAVTLLTDEHKRTEYDISGADTLHPQGSSANFGANAYQQFYHNRPDVHNVFDADEFSADDLFNMFFGNYPPHGEARRRPAYQSANQRTPQHHHQPSLAFGLILILIFISLFSTLFTSDPVFQLVQSKEYPIRRETQHLSVPYYVKANFENDYHGSLGRLENSVEKDFIYTMKQSCYRERAYRETMMARARSYGSRHQFAQAQGLKMPSCDNLSKIGITRFSF